MSEIWNAALVDYLVDKNYTCKYQIVCRVKNPLHYKDRIIQNFSFVQKAENVMTEVRYQISDIRSKKREFREKHEGPNI